MNGGGGRLQTTLQLEAASRAAATLDQESAIAPAWLAAPPLPAHRAAQVPPGQGVARAAHLQGRGQGPLPEAWQGQRVRQKWPVKLALLLNVQTAGFRILPQIFPTHTRPWQWHWPPEPTKFQQQVLSALACSPGWPWGWGCRSAGLSSLPSLDRSPKWNEGDGVSSAGVTRAAPATSWGEDKTCSPSTHAQMPYFRVPWLRWHGSRWPSRYCLGPVRATGRETDWPVAPGPREASGLPAGSHRGGIWTSPTRATLSGCSPWQGAQWSPHCLSCSGLRAQSPEGGEHPAPALEQ